MGQMPAAMKQSIGSLANLGLRTNLARRHVPAGEQEANAPKTLQKIDRGNGLGIENTDSMDLQNSTKVNRTSGTPDLKLSNRLYAEPCSRTDLDPRLRAVSSRELSNTGNPERGKRKKKASFDPGTDSGNKFENLSHPGPELNEAHLDGRGFWGGLNSTFNRTEPNEPPLTGSNRTGSDGYDPEHSEFHFKKKVNINNQDSEEIIDSQKSKYNNRVDPVILSSETI